MDNDTRMELDIRTTDLTMREVLGLIGELSMNDPGREYFIDGDTYAVVSRERRA